MVEELLVMITCVSVQYDTGASASYEFVIASITWRQCFSSYAADSTLPEYMTAANHVQQKYSPVCFY